MTAGADGASAAGADSAGAGKLAGSGAGIVAHPANQNRKKKAVKRRNFIWNTVMDQVQPAMTVFTRRLRLLNEYSGRRPPRPVETAYPPLPT